MKTKFSLGWLPVGPVKKTTGNAASKAFKTMGIKLGVCLMTLLCVGTAAAQDNNRQQKPIVLLDYLTVYPYDIGGFSEYPENVIEAINKKNMFGYNDWRVPTTEEYELIYASRNEVRGLKDFEGYCWYINKDGKYQQNYKGRLRLVTTSTKKVEIED